MTDVAGPSPTGRRSPIRVGVIAAGALLVLFVLLLVLARPASLAWIIVGAFVGLVLGIATRVLIARRVSKRSPAPTAEILLQRRTMSPRRSRAGLALAAAIGLAAVVGYTQVSDVATVAPPGPGPAAGAIQRVAYTAELTYTDPGRLDGIETFTLSRDEAARLVRATTGTLNSPRGGSSDGVDGTPGD